MDNSAEKAASARRRTSNRSRTKGRGHSRVRARPILPDCSYKITRRCLERRMLIAPGEHADKLNNFIGYCLAIAARKYGIQIHAAIMMSNHEHIDVTDTLGKLPAFKRWLHSKIARGVNALRGRSDKFWSADAPCDTRRATDDESFEDLVYTLTNPVKAGLVKWGSKWPGFTTHGWRFGETRKFKRPDWFFDPNGELPAEAELTLTRPPILKDLTDDELYERLTIRVREREVEHQTNFREQGRRFMGLDKLKKQHWNKAPTSFEKRFAQKPKVAASTDWFVLAELQRDRDWERRYAEALALHKRHEHAIFPAGTYWMRHFASVTVESFVPP